MKTRKGMQQRADNVMTPPTRRIRAIVCWLSVLARQVICANAAQLSPLGVMDKACISTANQDFNEHHQAFNEAITWFGAHLYRSGKSGAHVACTEYGKGRTALEKLKGFLAPVSVRALSNHREHGTCFIATSSAAEAAILSENRATYGLHLFFPLPSVVKLAPGLLNYTTHGAGTVLTHSDRLQTTYGKRTLMTNVLGLSVALSPGLLPADDVGAEEFFKNLRGNLMSASIDLHATSFWSDPDMVDSHRARPEGALRSREWTRAADVVHRLSVTGGPSPGDICSWGSLNVQVSGDEHVAITGALCLIDLFARHLKNCRINSRSA